MNSNRIAVALLVTATLGVSACGSGSDNDTPAGLKAQKQQILERGAEIRKDAAEANEKAAATAGSTKSYADKAIEDAKSRTDDPATRKAMDQVEKDLVEVPVPTPAP